MAMGRRDDQAMDGLVHDVDNCICTIACRWACRREHASLHKLPSIHERLVCWTLAHGAVQARPPVARAPCGVAIQQVWFVAVIGDGTTASAW